jgi:flagellar assembly protein FliH
LSNVIKATHYIPLDGKKLIQVAAASPIFPGADGGAGEEPNAQAAAAELAAAIENRDRILRDAEAYAESVIAQASHEAERLRQAALSEIDDWWRIRRADDERLVAEAREQGREAGYREGFEQAEAEVRRQYEQMLQEARAIIESAVANKQQLIQESEPFLIELSCAIAEKIVGRQLSIEPEWTLDLIRNVLRRRKEQGVITLCVSPGQFQFVQDAREELMLAVDSQAEIQIIPDPSVRDHGCVVRSSFGSIDARIDTQLDEIKNQLRQVALGSMGVASDE